MKLEFLPAYSPDFNPIELSFSLLKARLRNVRWSHEGVDAVILQLYGEVMSISAQDCRAFYAHCGYIRWCEVVSLGIAYLAHARTDNAK